MAKLYFYYSAMNAGKSTVLKTICHCGRKATMNLRTDAAGKPIKEGEQVEIGGNESYVAMCRKHYVEAMS